MFIYHLFIYYNIYGNNIQHSMLSFPINKCVLLQKDNQEHIANKNSVIFGNLE